MKKIYKESQLFELYNLQVRIIENIGGIIYILSENYGEKREVDSDLGRYVLIAENIVDIEILKLDKLQGLVQEYTI